MLLLKSITRCLSVLLVVLGCCVPASDVRAQQANPPAPRVYRPKARAISSRYVPNYMRRTSMQENIQPQEQATPTQPQNAPILGNDQPIGSVVDEYVPQPVMGDGCNDCNSGHVIGGPVDQVFAGDSCGGCYDSCGGCEVDCRDCGINQDCWLFGLGGILRNSEYLLGVQSFKTVGGVNTTDVNNPCSFGYNIGVNAGLPLYNVTCGLVSGQLGLRYVQSNFEGDIFASERRNQLFFTGGLYRRVDYGIQLGVVADILREEWITNIDVVQVRGELSYVWPAGHTFGFRFGVGVQDDDSTQVVRAYAMNNYRFFYRHICGGGGYSEFFAGWTEENHGIIGVDYDLPLNERVALETGFTYLIPDDENQIFDTESWNISLGVAYRPRGRCWYKFYHRPLLPVADNGSLLLREE